MKKIFEGKGTIQTAKTLVRSYPDEVKKTRFFVYLENGELIGFFQKYKEAVEWLDSHAVPQPSTHQKIAQC